MIGTFVEPIVFGKRLNLTMSSIIVALLFWGYVWGIPGMILCATAAAQHAHHIVFCLYRTVRRLWF
jgi:predicted PurR-regulated permease PerM